MYSETMAFGLTCARRAVARDKNAADLLGRLLAAGADKQSVRAEAHQMECRALISGPYRRLLAARAVRLAAAILLAKYESYCPMLSAQIAETAAMAAGADVEPQAVSLASAYVERIKQVEHLLQWPPDATRVAIVEPVAESAA